MQKPLAVNKCDGPTQQGVESRLRDQKKSKRKKKGSKREREADKGLQERMVDGWIYE